VSRFNKAERRARGHHGHGQGASPEPTGQTVSQVRKRSASELMYTTRHLGARSTATRMALDARRARRRPGLPAIQWEHNSRRGDAGKAALVCS
jgi:hypothetical protein